jgi:hypothetical protein
MIRRLMTGVSLAAMTLAAQAAFNEEVQAAPHTFIVGLGEDCVPPTAALSEQLMQLFVKDLHPGDNLIVYDAPKRVVIATITLPDREAFERPAVRIQQFGAELVKIRRFLEARCRAAPEGAGPADNLYFPQFLDEIDRDRTEALPRGSASLLVVGSALYNDPGDPGISMLGGHYPSDSHLNAAPSASVFSTADKRAALAGVDVHYCFTDKSWFSDTDQKAVLRWWSLYVGSQQGLLATFTGDVATCFERFEHSITAGAPVFKVETSGTELEMLMAQRAPITRQNIVLKSAPAPAPRPVDNHYEVSSATPPAGAGFLDAHATISHEAPQTWRGLAKIGISWSCPVDLDIYARGSSQNPFLYYGHTDSSEGHFPHDYTNAPGGSSFEYVEFTHPIDLSTMEAFVNFYGGSCASGPSGIVRLWFDNRIYEGHFALTATIGNHGQRESGQMTGPDWTEINVKSLLHEAAREQEAGQ